MLIEVRQLRYAAMTADKRSFARAVDALGTKQTAIPERFNSNSQLTVNGSCPPSLIAGKGVERGWLCGRKADGINFGLTVSSRDPTHRFSIDVVEMQYVVAPNHVHPGGEINLIMLYDERAKCGAKTAGWSV